MRKLDMLTKSIHKFILRDPNTNVVLIEVVEDNKAEKVIIEKDDYVFTMIGNDVLFDSIERIDGEPLFSLDFKFLDSIDRKIRNNKTVIDKHNLSPNMVFIKIRRLVKDIDLIGYTDIRVHMCDIDALEIKRTTVYSCWYTTFDKSITLTDEFGDECKLTQGGN